MLGSGCAVDLVLVDPVDGSSASIVIELISGVRGGGNCGSGGGRSWSLVSAVVCVVTGAIRKPFTTKKPFMGASFSYRSHYYYFLMNISLSQQFIWAKDWDLKEPSTTPDSPIGNEISK